jgi:magnesium chelatase family protein
MQATALAITLVGLDSHLVRVEVDSGRGPACFNLVGLAEASVRESRVRVRAALQQLGVDVSEYVITVNLAPADLRKGGGAFDVAIALATLGALGKLLPDALDGTAFLGELSLSGTIHPVRGILPALRGAVARGVRRVVVPGANAAEAALVPGVVVLVADHLSELFAHFAEGKPLRSAGEAPPFSPGEALAGIDLAEVRGQHAARRALEVAAAGGHNLLMVGTPGNGKTMLARRLATILPPLDIAEALEVTAIQSIAGLLHLDDGVVTVRPFRAPHHTVSQAGLIGGGEPVRPGEVSLAHHGVLFLDELLEFPRGVLEVLRQPLEDGQVTICRARTRATFPARPMLVAAVNPCPCGYAGDPRGRCACGPERVRAYRSKLSGPLLDRIDLHLVLAPVDVSSLTASSLGESSATVRARVVAARGMQLQRHAAGEVRGRVNAELSSSELERVAKPDRAGAQLLSRAVEQLGLSARAYGKVLRVARSLADLEGVDGLRSVHVAEAVQARLLDREASSGRALGLVARADRGR